MSSNDNKGSQIWNTRWRNVFLPPKPLLFGRCCCCCCNIACIDPAIRLFEEFMKCDDSWFIPCMLDICPGPRIPFKFCLFNWEICEGPWMREFYIHKFVCVIVYNVTIDVISCRCWEGCPMLWAKSAITVTLLLRCQKHLPEMFAFIL